MKYKKGDFLFPSFIGKNSDVEVLGSKSKTKFYE